MQSLFCSSTPSDGNETIETVFQNDHIRIEQIISFAQASPKDFWYDQDTDEWVCLLKGNAVLAFQNEMKSLTEGNYLFIPRHVKHRVETVSQDAVWLAVHLF